MARNYEDDEGRARRSPVGLALALAFAIMTVWLAGLAFQLAPLMPERAIADAAVRPDAARCTATATPSCVDVVPTSNAAAQ